MLHRSFGVFIIYKEIDMVSKAQQRKQAEFTAAVWDLFYRYKDDWDTIQRENSTTGENMTQENMSEDEMKRLEDHFYAKALINVSVRNTTK